MYYQFVYEGECACPCPVGWDVMDMGEVLADGVKVPSVEWDEDASSHTALVKWPVDPYREIDNIGADLLREQVKAWAWLMQQRPTV